MATKKSVLVILHKCYIFGLKQNRYTIQQQFLIVMPKLYFIFQVVNENMKYLI